MNIPGLVQTLQQKASGGSKFHRRKIGIILERLAKGMYKVAHVADASSLLRRYLRKVGPSVVVSPDQPFDGRGRLHTRARSALLPCVSKAPADVLQEVLQRIMDATRPGADTADDAQVWLVTPHFKSHANVGPLVRASSAFSAAELLLVGADRCTTHGAHGRAPPQL